jgi:hypothetical protein
MANRSTDTVYGTDVAFTSNSRRYRDASNNELITANNVTLSAPKNTVFEVAVIGVTSGGGDDSIWDFDQCSFYFDGISANNQFKQGQLLLTNCKIVLTDDQRLVWPCNFLSFSGNGFSFDLTNTQFDAPEATGTNGFVVHFGGANLSATNTLDGLVLGENCITQAPPGIIFNNVTFSSSSSTAAGSFSNYFRFVPGVSDATELWSGLFGCDCTAWPEDGATGETDDHVGVFNIDWEDDIGETPWFFVVNCDFAAGIDTLRMYYDASVNPLPVGSKYEAISGRAWKAAFALPDGTVTSSNYKIDFAADDVYEAQATVTPGTKPTLLSSSGGANLRDWRTDGWIIIEDSQTVTQDSTTDGHSTNYDDRLDVEILERDLKVFSYEDESWDISDGTANTVATVKSPISNGLVIGAAENYFFNATGQTAISKATAELLRAGTNTIDDFDDLLAAVRKDAWDNGDDLLVYSTNPTSNTLTVPVDVQLSDNSGALSVAASIISGNFGATLGAGTFYNKIQQNVELLGSLAIGTGANFGGDVTLNSVQNLTDVTIDGDLHLNVAGTYTFSNVTVTGDTLNDDASGNIIIQATNGSSLSTSEPGTGNGEVDIQNSVNVTFSGVIVGSNIHLEATAAPLGDGTELEKVTTTTDPHVYVHNYTADQPFRYTIANRGGTLYKQERGTGTIESTGFSVEVTQEVD